MIIVDYKKGGEKDKDTPQEFVDKLNKLGVKAEKGDLEFADFAFEGHGPDGSVAVGIERKTLNDLLACIQDGRLSGHQLPGMRQMYQIRILLVEGHWRPHDPNGMLMEGFNGGYNWSYNRYRSRRTMYSEVYRYLIGIQLSGVMLTLSRDVFHSAYNIHEWYHYFQKPWHLHTSLKELHQIAIPTLNRKPTLVRKWAHALDDIGVKISELAERHFKTGIKLATADETEWLKVPGVGVKTAQDIVREIWGNR